MVGSLQVRVKVRVKDMKLTPWARYWAGLQGAGRSSQFTLLKLPLGGDAQSEDTRGAVRLHISDILTFGEKLIRTTMLFFDY